jgi:hypothetical protein
MALSTDRLHFEILDLRQQAEARFQATDVNCGFRAVCGLSGSNRVVAENTKAPWGCLLPISPQGAAFKATENSIHNPHIKPI